MPYDPIGLKESTPLSVSRSISAYDYLRISEGFFRVDRSLVFPDLIDVVDESILTKENAVLSNDSLIYDSVSYKGATQVNALDVFSDDNISYTKTYSPILFTMLAYRVRPRYLTLSVSDVISTTDYVTYTKIYSPILFTMLAYRVRPRYLTLSVSDYKLVYDYMPVAKGKSVSVYDKMGYDYVPNMNPSNVHFMSIYPNPTTYGILVSDYGVSYDSATAVRPYKPVVISDIIGVNDGVSMKNMTVMVYDKLIADNAALNNV
jgi:hypothetical protein